MITRTPAFPPFCPYGLFWRNTGTCLTLGYAIAERGLLHNSSDPGTGKPDTDGDGLPASSSWPNGGELSESSTGAMPVERGRATLAPPPLTSFVGSRRSSGSEV